MKKQLLQIGQLAVDDLPALRAAVIALGNERELSHQRKHAAMLRLLRKRIAKADSLKAKGIARELLAISEKAAKRGSDWKRYAIKFVAFLDTGKPQFTVYMKGNSKLPFYAFSALPIITCPGFGACGEWCYSFKAWRYPAAFFRQLQNTVLILHQRETLAREFDKLPYGVVFRLYVDGDIDSLRTLGFWMDLLRTRPDVAAYGYSKSWPLFLSYAASNQFPPNYKLNLSGGGRYGDRYKGAMLALDCVRGEFVAFPVATRQKASPAQYRRDVAQAAKAAGHTRVFVCPGKCGECANGKHACGSAKFAGVAVAIGIH